MSCPICRRTSCCLSFHSLDAQERYEARQSMSDDVEELREQLQDTLEDLAAAQQRVEELEAERDRMQGEGLGA